MIACASLHGRVPQQTTRTSEPYPARQPSAPTVKFKMTQRADKGKNAVHRAPSSAFSAIRFIVDSPSAPTGRCLWLVHHHRPPGRIHRTTATVATSCRFRTDHRRRPHRGQWLAAARSPGVSAQSMSPANLVDRRHGCSPLRPAFDARTARRRSPPHTTYTLTAPETGWGSWVIRLLHTRSPTRYSVSPKDT